MAQDKEILIRENSLGGVLEGAPEWYGKSLDELDFPWSREEELEIERYCEKILKNVAEEEMTPLERWKAQMTGKPKDRRFLPLMHMNVYVARTLDSYADALKPGDLYRNPKLLFKAYLATVARFKSDFPCLHVTSYNQELWGGRAAMGNWGNPDGKGDPPMKTLEDLEGLGDGPDPKEHGLYPGWLWVIREMRRIYDKYSLPLPFWTSLGPDPTCSALLGMLGWTGFFIALRRNPELARRCSELGAHWNLKLAKALHEVARPDGMWVCQNTGMFPMKGNEWVADQLDQFVKDVKAFAPDMHLSHGYSWLSGMFEWWDIMYERGAMAPDALDGGLGGDREAADWQKILDWHREHNLWISIGARNATLEKGPVSDIEEEIKMLYEYGKSHPKFSVGFIPIYWMPPEFLDAGIAAAKKYGRD